MDEIAQDRTSNKECDCGYRLQESLKHTVHLHAPENRAMTENLKEERLEIKEWHRMRELERPASEAIKEQEKVENKRLITLEQKAKIFTKSQYIYDFLTEIEQQRSHLDYLGPKL